MYRHPLLTGCAVVFVATIWTTVAHAEIVEFLGAKGPSVTAEQQAWLTKRAEHRKKIDALAEEDIAAAIRAAEHLVAIDRETFGKNHPQTADALEYLSILHYMAVNPAAYETDYLAIIDIVKAVLGERHWKVRVQQYLMNRNVLLLQSPREARVAFSRAQKLKYAAEAQLARGENREVIDTAAKALALYPAAFGKNTPIMSEVAETISFQAMAYLGLGELEKASELNDQATKVYASIYGKDSILYAFRQHARAEIEYGRRNLDEAERASRTALEYYEKEFSGKGNEVARELQLLGGIYTLRNEPGRAEELTRRALKLFADAFGKESTRYNDALASLSNILIKQGKMDEAEKLLRETLAFYGKNSNGKTLKYAGRLHGVAALFVNSPQKASESIKMINEGLEIVEKLAGKKSVSYAQMLNTRAAAERTLKQYSASDDSLRQSLSTLQELTGKKTEDIQKIATSLLVTTQLWSKANSLEGKGDEIRKLAARTQPILEQIFGPTNWRVIEARLTFAAFERAAQFTPEQRRRDTVDEQVKLMQDSFSTSKTSEAVAAMERAIAIREELYGKDDVFLPGYWSRLGTLRGANGEIDRSVQAFRRSAELHHLLWNDEPSPEYGAVVMELAALERGCEKLPAALTLCQEGRRLYRSWTGAASAQYRWCTGEAAVILIDLGEFERASTLLRELVALEERAGGKKSPRYALALTYQGLLQLRLGEIAKASQLFDQASVIFVADSTSKGETSSEHIEFVVLSHALFAEGDDFDAAIPSLAWAIEAIPKTNLRPQAARLQIMTRRGLGIAYLQKGEYEKAESFLREAIAIRHKAFGKEKSTHRRELVYLIIARNRLAEKALQSDKMDECIAIMRQTAATVGELAGDDDHATVDARAAVTTIEMVAKLTPQQRKLFQNYFDTVYRTQLLVRQKKLNEALFLTTDGLQKQEQLLGDDPWSKATLLWANAFVMTLAGKPAVDIVNRWQQLIDFGTKKFGPKSVYVGIAKAGIGQTIFGQQPQKAVGLLKEGTDILRQALGSDSPDYATAMMVLGMAAYQTGDMGGAEQAMRPAMVTLSRSSRTHLTQYVDSLGMFSQVLRELGDTERAELLGRRQRDLAQKLSGKKSAAFAVANMLLGELYASMHDVTKAEPVLREAADACRQVFGPKSINYARALLNLANVLRDRGDWAVAEPLYSQVKEIYPAGSKHLVTLEHARMELKRGDTNRADELFQEVARFQKANFGEASSQYGGIQADLGDAAFQKSGAAAAEPFYRKHLERWEFGLRQYALAQTEAQQLTVANRTRKSLDNYLSLGDAVTPAQAYCRVLAWKGSILERQQRIRGRQGDPKNAALLKDWEHLTGEMATLALRPPYPEDRDLWASQIRDLSAARDGVERNLILAQVPASPLPTADDVTQVLPENVTLIDYLQYHARVPNKDKPGSWIEEQRLVAFVLHRGQAVHRVELGVWAPILLSIEAWQKERDHPEDSGKSFPELDKHAAERVKTILEVGKPVHAAVWAPLQKYFAGADTIVICPDGDLAMFPFAALPGKADNTFLIEDVTLSTIAVPAELAAVRKPVTSSGMFGIGAVEFGGDPGLRETDRRLASRGGPLRWKFLESSGREIDQVSKLFKATFPSAEIVVQKGHDAKEQEFRKHAAKARWIHLATHGFFVQNLMDRAFAEVPKIVLLSESAPEIAGLGDAVTFHPGLLSGVAFAGANTPHHVDEDDGILYAVEAASMDLSNTELVVLSACDTGLGTTTKGEGVLGLQRAFQEAGARTVVASLWPVEDHANASMMGLFYGNHWRQKLSKAEALRRAQLEFIREARKSLQAAEDKKVIPASWLEPSYWAPMVLSGDWR